MSPQQPFQPIPVSSQASDREIDAARSPLESGSPYLTSEEAVEILRFGHTKRPIQNLHQWAKRQGIPKAYRGRRVLWPKHAILSAIHGSRTPRRRRARRMAAR